MDLEASIPNKTGRLLNLTKPGFARIKNECLSCLGILMNT